MGSSLRHAGSFIAAHGLLCSGMRVFSSLVVGRAPGRMGSVVCGTWALVEARELSSCGMQA